MRSLVSRGHLICTKWTSAAAAMPASFMASATALDVSEICSARPISSGLKGRVRPDGQPLGRYDCGRSLAAKDQEMRRQPAFGAPGHDHCHAPVDFGGRALEALGKQELQRKCRVTAGEVVDAAVSFGLANNRHDRSRINLAAVDGGSKRRRVLRACSGEPQYSCSPAHVALPASLPWRSRRRRTMIVEARASAMTRKLKPVVTVPRA